jgi:DNA-binding beta-propeller fold protein YncE
VNVRDLNCADNLADISDTGVLTTSVTGDFLPLCNSEIFVSNQLLNQVELINVDTGELVSSYQLSGAPTDLEYDKESGKLYVGLSAATFFAVIDTINDTVDYVQTRDVVYQISLDDAGGLFLSIGKDSYYKSLYKLDSDSIWLGPWPIAGSAFGYNKNRNEIVTGTFGLSPVKLTRYGFDDLGELIELESLRTGGGNGQDLAISNDGRSFALAAGGGNGLGYTIFDYSSEDLSVTFGEWVTGAYPSGVAFSPDDSIVATSNYTSLILFNRSTHAELMRKDIPACDYGNASKVRFSKGGALAFIKQTCGFDDETVKIYYFKIPQG